MTKSTTPAPPAAKPKPRPGVRHGGSRVLAPATKADKSAKAAAAKRPAGDNAPGKSGA